MGVKHRLDGNNLSHPSNELVYDLLYFRYIFFGSEKQKLMKLNLTKIRLKLIHFQNKVSI